jgi:hypothetical protein
MKRKYYPYTQWEEVNYGMYKMIDGAEKKEMIDLAILLLTDPQELKIAMMDTLVVFPNSTERNFTTPGLNKQAWLGQAACSLVYNVPEDLTKEAWGMLNDKQRIEANRVADEVINYYTGGGNA